jgi:hypothetical protein
MQKTKYSIKAQMLSLTRLGYYLVIILSILPLQADEEIIIEDTFTTGSSSREAGASLNGQKIEKGEGTWYVPKESLGFSAIFTENGTISVKRPDQHALASVPVHASDKATTLSADVRPFTSDWIALAFFPEAESMDWFESKIGKDVFWVYLRPNGFVQLLRAGRDGISLIGQSEAPGTGFDSSQFHSLSMSYDPSTNKMSVDLDGRAVIKPTVLGDPKCEISAVGFRINNIQGQEPGEPQIDNFKYVITP